MRTAPLLDERASPPVPLPSRLINKNARPRLKAAAERCHFVSYEAGALPAQQLRLGERSSGWVRPLFALLLVLISGLGTVLVAWACVWIVWHGWSSFLRAVSWPWTVGVCRLVPYADIPPVRCDQANVVQRVGD